MSTFSPYRHEPPQFIIRLRGYAYPVWQVGLEGLGAVLAELAEYDPWTQTLFMLSANPWLEGETPLVALRRGQRDAVLAAARLYGQQTAA